MKLLLDMYRSAPKEQRDKVQLMAAEKKYNSEVITPHIIYTDFVGGAQKKDNGPIVRLIFLSLCCCSHLYDFNSNFRERSCGRG